MSKVQEIMKALNYNFRPKGDKQDLSLPFIVNDEGKGKIAVFKFLKNEGEIDIINCYLINYESLDVQEFEITDELTFVFNEDNIIYTKEDLNKYYDYLNLFFKNKGFDKKIYNQLFSKVSDGLKEAYLYWGAEFIE